MLLHIIFLKLQCIPRLLEYYAFLFVFFSKMLFSKFSLISMKPEEPIFLNCILSFNFITKIKKCVRLEMLNAQIASLQHSSKLHLEKKLHRKLPPQPTLVPLLLLLLKFIPLS